ncbi:MAG: ferredoxin [Thermoplasmata archaeon]|nr:ferredoxin [Thermoplasmata archaeon]
MVSINKERCVGCGVCENVCPDGFQIFNGLARVKDENAECIKEAARACPKGAIATEGEGVDVNDRPSRLGGGAGRGRGMGGRSGHGQGMGRGKGHGQGPGNRWR